jgi:hypothetical protein
MKKIFKVLYILFSVCFLFYLALPNFSFPIPPPGAVQSKEPGDNETPLRRAYFTDLGREEVMHYYQNELSRSSLMSIPIPAYRLNYPPEEAKTIIRDQTRSTFLEEIVHPFRESVYINGFEPNVPKDTIIIDGRHFRQKIIVKIFGSSLLVRFSLGVFTLLLIGVVYSEGVDGFKNFARVVLRRKND